MSRKMRHGADAVGVGMSWVAGLPGWVRVDSPQRWDIAVFRHNGRPAHVGVCIDASRFLHVEEGGTSRIDRFGPTRPVEAIYRYAG